MQYIIVIDFSFSIDKIQPILFKISLKEYILQYSHKQMINRDIKNAIDEGEIDIKRNLRKTQITNSDRLKNEKKSQQ